MANRDGEAARNKFMDHYLKMFWTAKLVFMDLRAPADEELLKEVEDKLSVLSKIKGV